MNGPPTQTVIGQITVTADAEVIKADDGERATPNPEEDES